MARFRVNLIANLAGAGWSACLQLLCVPVIVRLIGVEAYGLIGFFVTLQASLQMLDLGFSTTVNRELARYSTRLESSDESRDFLRTMELVYWGIGIGIGTAIMLLAPSIARHWIQAQHMSLAEVEQAIKLIGVVITLQWPLSFYQGGLMGLQRMTQLNAVRIGSGTLSYGGGLIVLWLISASARSYFLWQSFASFTQVTVTAAVLWKSMPEGTRWPLFDCNRLRGVAHFAAGMGGIAVLGTILGQMDKVVLSRILPLDQFGCYTLAGLLVSGLNLFVSPVFSAVFPRLSEMVARGQREPVRETYHEATQIMACLVLPLAGLMVAFAPLCAVAWTGDTKISGPVASIVSILVVGTAINGLMHIPFALQLAYGWTRLGLQLALLKVALFAPLTVWAAVHFGAKGGAATWALLNIFYLVVGLPLTHRRLLPGEMLPWLLRDLGYPLLAVAVVMAVARCTIDAGATGFAAQLRLAALALSALLAAGLAAPYIRRRMIIRSRILPTTGS